MSGVKLFARIVIMSAIMLLNSACGSDQQKAHYTGYIETDLIYIAAPQSGWIESLHIKEGERVDTGQLLFKLDNELQQDNVDQLTAQLRQAQAQEQDLLTGARQQEIEALQTQQSEAIAALKLAAEEQIRIAALFKQGLVPAAELDKANADLEMAQSREQKASANIDVAKLAARPAQQDAAVANRFAAQAALNQANWQLKQRNVVSRVTGSIDELIHYQGEYVNAGSPVLALLSKQAIKARFFVPQAELVKFKVGKKVSVVADGKQQPLTAHISFIAEHAEFTPPVIYTAESRQKLVFMLEARLDHSANLPAGLPVEVRLK